MVLIGSCKARSISFFLLFMTGIELADTVRQKGAGLFGVLLVYSFNYLVLSISLEIPCCKDLNWFWFWVVLLDSTYIGSIG